MSTLSSVAMAPRDPILGLTEQFNADPKPDKVNLGVGVYYDENGKLPLLKCVEAAEAALVASPTARGYLPIDGLAAYDSAVQTLVFDGDDAVADGRIATVQTLGGTGGLKVGADFLRRVVGATKVLLSTPSWENHQALFAGAGFDVASYPYYDPARLGIDVEGMLDTIGRAEEGTVVVLHACCHNPTGYDLTDAQWDQVANVIATRGLVPFLDMAYQGFGDGVEEDGEAVRVFLRKGIEFFVSTSFSKSFSLYGERVGSLNVVAASADDAKRVLSQLKVMVRTNYSNPPTHGAKVVAAVLASPELRTQWEAELAGMRLRIKEMRAALAEGLKAAGVTSDVSYITTQRGMFSYSGLSVEQMTRLRDEFGVYGLDSGRICVAALNHSNIERVAKAMAAVMQG